MIDKNFEWRDGSAHAYYANSYPDRLMEFGRKVDNCFISKYALCQHLVTADIFVLTTNRVQVSIELHRQSKMIYAGLPRKMISADSFFSKMKKDIIKFLKYLDAQVEIDWEKTSKIVRYDVIISKVNGEIDLVRNKSPILFLLPKRNDILQYYDSI